MCPDSTSLKGRKMPNAPRYWPLARGFIVTSGFGPRNGGPHTGTDFGKTGGSAGLPVYAVQSGTVIYAGAADGYGGPDPAGWLVIDSSDAEGAGCVEYGHIIREVKVGDKVKAGQRIARINPSSATNGGVAPHLHLSVMPREYNPSKKMNPIPWLGEALYPGEAVAPPVVITPPKGYTMKEIDQTGQPGTPNSSSRWGAKVRLFVLHTQEGNGTAQSLAGYLQNANSQVSYHYSIDNNTCIDVLDTDRASWSVLDANPYTINLCFAGSRASQSRDVWLTSYGNAIDYAAFLFVQDAKKYGVDARTLSWAEIGAGKSGGTDHLGITRGLGIGTHTDCGPNFPWDVFAAAVNKYVKGVTPPVVVPPVEVPNAIAEIAKLSPWLGKKLTTELELTTPDGRGRYAHYENGSVYWTPENGARPIPTYLRATYEELGWEAGPLGYPIAFHTVLADGEVQAFEKGVLYRKGHPGQNEKPGYFVTGKIGERWKREGFENSSFGWPTSNEISVGDGSIIQHFEHEKYIVWSPDGTVAMSSVDGPDIVVPDPH